MTEKNFVLANQDLAFRAQPLVTKIADTVQMKITREHFARVLRKRRHLQGRFLELITVNERSKCHLFQVIVKNI